MKNNIMAIALMASASHAFAAESFCDTGRPHPIDMQFERDMDQSGGATSNMRNAQSKAYEDWEKALNREYQELMKLLSAEEKASLREAQRAWLSFRDAESEF